MKSVNLIRAKLSEKRGEVALRGAVILLVAMLLFAVALQIIHVYHTITVVEDKTSEAVLATAALNVSGIFQGVRESDWRARQYSDSEWTGTVDASQVIQQLVQSTGGTQTGADSLLVKNSYQITDLSTSYDNDSGDGLLFATTLKLDIFFKIGGIIDTVIPLELEVSTTYTPKF